MILGLEMMKDLEECIGKSKHYFDSQQIEPWGLELISEEYD